MTFLHMRIAPARGPAVNLNLPFPRCAVCRREVDAFEHQLDGEDVLLIARCHADCEEVRVPRRLLSPGARVSVSSAFMSASHLGWRQSQAVRR